MEKVKGQKPAYEANEKYFLETNFLLLGEGRNGFAHIEIRMPHCLPYGILIINRNKKSIIYMDDDAIRGSEIMPEPAPHQNPLGLWFPLSVKKKDIKKIK